MKKLILLFLFQLLSSSPLFAKHDEFTKEEIKEAVKTFKLKKEWINPKIIKEFLPWSSDRSFPLITSIDVAAASGTNRFFDDFETNKNRTTLTIKDEGTLTVEWMGVLKNGMHVLMTTESGSGTLVSNNILVFKLHPHEAMNGSGKKYQQLLLEIQRIAILGDRADSTVSIKGNEIDVKVKCEKTCDSKDFKLSF